MPTTTPPTCHCLTGSTGGRGPCEACGRIDELHLAEELALTPWGDVLGVRASSRAVCLPCAERPELAEAA